MKRFLIPIILFCCTASAQDTLKVMSWNLLNYVDASRDQYYRTVLRHVKPDLLVVEEMTSQAMVDNFFSNVVNLVFPGQFSKSAFVDGPDTDNELYYRTSKFTFLSNTPIHTALRDISQFKLYNATAADTLFIYAVHLKASSGSANEIKRAAEVDSLRKVTNSFPDGKFFMVVGDFNIYGSTESAYQKLLADNPTDDGHFVDPLTMPGTWNTASYAPFHTQSPRVRSFGGGATGGLDDRFDMILHSRALTLPGGKIQRVPGSLTPIGNDGNHYNDSINHLPNTAVPDSVANALHAAADHLPVSELFVFRSTGITTYAVTASAGSNGSINPSGVVNVPSGSNQTFTITPNTGYHITDVLVDGGSVGAVGSYTFTNVTATHTISASFGVNVYTIAASAGANGGIAPSGNVNVNYNASQAFTITPSTGYHVQDVLVDNSSVGPVGSYTFNNVAANHTINATFAINQYTLSASSGPNGSISPNGAVAINYGGNRTFLMTPATGYHVDSVIVDNVKVDSVASYTFVSVTANHSIRATFSINQYTITASAGAHGTIAPSGVIVANYGTSQMFTMNPDSAYVLDSLFVDGLSVTPSPTYQFTGIAANHTIAATFRASMAVAQINVVSQWNVVSLPLTVTDRRTTVLFPTATSTAFAFDPASGYSSRDSLKNGIGYWLKFPSPQTVGITGVVRPRDTVDVRTGWNLIGSISTAIPASSITQIPAGIVQSPYFGYNGGYTASDTVHVGKGYWVKVSQNGRLVLQYP